MSDFMPDKIIARPMMGTLPHGKTHTSGPWSLDDPYANGKLYISADLPPTRDQIMADPRVRALVEALMLYADPCEATETSGCGFDGNMCCKSARTALATLIDNEGETE